MQKILEKFMKKYWKNAKKTGKVREIHQSKKVGTMYKILTGKYDKSVTEFMPMQNSSSTSLPTRGHILKLYQ